MEINNCIKILKAGGVILYPTDTIWGLGCDATNLEAIAKIYKIKQREEAKSLIILCQDSQQVSNYADNSNPEIANLFQNTSKPLTVIYSNAKNCTNQDGTIAIRIPNHQFCQELLRAFGKPIVSTSANISGEATAFCFDEISTQILESVDYIVQIERDKISTQSSKMVKIQDGQIITIRD